MSAYLLKPIRQSELRGAIAMVLGSRPKDGTVALITRFSVRDARQLGIALAILVTEDYVVNQRLVARMLEREDIKFSWWPTGRKRWTHLPKMNMTLFLWMCRCPEMDGLTATTILREREAGSRKHQVVIALTAHALKGDEERCLAAGMDAYLSKPIQPQALDEKCQLPALNKGSQLVTSLPEK